MIDPLGIYFASRSLPAFMSVAADIFVDLLIPLPATYIDAGSCLDPNTELAADNVIKRIVYIEEAPHPFVLETHVD